MQIIPFQLNSETSKYEVKITSEAQLQSADTTYRIYFRFKSGESIRIEDKGKSG